MTRNLFFQARSSNHTVKATRAPLAGPHRSRGYSREIVLILCAVLLLALSSVTALVSRLYHKKIHTLADQWFSRGELTLKSGAPSAALIDYRNALVYSPTNTTFQFHLAQALSAAGHTDEARPYLTNLLAESPGRGDVNLELARIAVRQNSPSDALLYYHSAIYGVWESDPVDTRWSVRRELCEYLLDRHDLSDARPELIALSQDIPPADSEGHLETANLLLRGGLWQNALDQFRLAQSAGPRQQDALVGMVLAEYQLGHYAQAHELLLQIPKGKRSDPAVMAVAAKVNEVEDADPFSPALPPPRRAELAAHALAQADSRLADCAHDKGMALSTTPPVSELQTIYANRQLTATLYTPPSLARHPDRIEAAMTLVFQMEAAATRACGPPVMRADQVLELLAASRGAETGARNAVSPLTGLNAPRVPNPAHGPNAPSASDAPSASNALQ